MGWKALLFLLALILKSESHPIEEPENVRETRDVEECCPCPKPSTQVLSSSRALSAIEDCPCLPRSADSEGAPSIFTPTAVRAARPFMRPDAKDDMKPLLHPEVDLASSVLNTLREATEEEYRDALARDAARSAVRETDEDEPATNIINIIVSPKPTTNAEEDPFPDASHVQEARCIPSPLGKSNLKMTARKPPSLLKDIFGLDSKPLGILHKNGLDMDNGASSIHEHVLESVNSGLKGLKLRSNPSLLNLFPNERETKEKNTLSNFMSSPRLRQNKKQNNNNLKIVFGSAETKVVELSKNRNNNVEPGTASSNLNNNFLASSNRETLDNFKSRPIAKASEKIIKNLMKLKDVELLPSKKVTLPRLKLPKFNRPLLPAQRKSHKTIDNYKPQRANDEDECQENIKESESSRYVQTIPRKKIETEIIDAAPSPSQNKDVFLNNNDESKLNTNELEKNTQCENLTENEHSEANVNKESGSEEFEKNNDFNVDEFSKSNENDEQLAVDTESKELQFNKESIPENDNNEDNCNGASVIQPITFKPGSVVDEVTTNESESSKPLSLEDLQAMSDSLLDASREKEKMSSSPTCIAENMPVNNIIIDSNEETTSNSLSNNDLLENDKLVPTSSLSEEHADDNNSNAADDENIEPQTTPENETSSLNTKNVDPCEKTKTSTTASPLLEKGNHDDCVKKEMTAAASDPISDTVSRLFPSTRNSKNSIGQNNIVQPSSLINGGDLDFLKPIDLGDILNFNTQLPTLEELRSRLSSILGMGINLTPPERATDDDLFSTELETDFTNTSPVMSAAASEPFSSIASLRPLEDMNLDIFQVKPLGMRPGSKFSVPGLNLNHVKAKLPVPKNMDLKPLRLESRIGNKEVGILGSTLTFGPAPMSSRKNKNSFDVLHSPSNLMESLSRGTPIQSLPSLDEIRSSLRSDAQNLLTTSKIAASKIPSNSFSENLRSHSDNAARNLQKTFDSTFKEPNVLSSSLPKPEHVLGMVSQAHNDVNNKLKELHSDLNDHLTYFRDSIVVDAAPKHTPLLGSKNRHHSKPTFLRTHTKVLESIPKRLNTKKPQTRAKSNSLRTIDRMNRLNTAASVPIPKTVEVPKLKKTEEPSPLRSMEFPLRRNMDILKPLTERKTASDMIRLKAADRNKNPLIKPFKPLGEFKVSFATTSTTTTTARTPLFKKRITMPTTKKPTLLKGRIESPNPSKRPGLTTDSIRLSKLNPTSIKDPKISPSNKVLTKRPLLEKTDTKEAKTQKGTLKKTEPENIVWPKLGDNSFLTQVREAVKARLADLRSPKLQENKLKARSKTGTDMSSGASEIVERKSSLKSNAPLKENVKYKCKLVCVKEVDNSDD